MDVRDLALRALHTFWQTFLASLGVVWAASGLDVGQVTDLDSAKRFALGALAAVAAAALSAAKSTGRAFLDRRAAPTFTDAQLAEALARPTCGREPDATP